MEAQHLYEIRYAHRVSGSIFDRGEVRLPLSAFTDIEHLQRHLRATKIISSCVRLDRVSTIDEWILVTPRSGRWFRISLRRCEAPELPRPAYSMHAADSGKGYDTRSLELARAYLLCSRVVKKRAKQNDKESTVSACVPPSER